MSDERFWAKVEKTKTCWIWKGATNGRYGMIRRGAGSKQNTRRVSAHRYAFELANGSVSPELVVMYTCDTPLCVRPDHLTTGTQADNIHDMIRKGRAYWMTV